MRYTLILYRYKYIMERGLTHLLHAFILGVLLYILMVFLLKQTPVVAEKRSILIGSIALIYMLFYGHRLPRSLPTL